MDILTQGNLGSIGGDEVLDIFDDSDWDFFNCDEEFAYFGECEDDFMEHAPSKYDRVSAVASAGIVATILLGTGTYVCKQLYDYRTDSSIAVTDTSKPQIVSGESVDSATEIAINRGISDYMGVLTYGLGFDKLNSYCVGQSSIYKGEAKYRESSQFSFDTNDCYARSVRAFSKSISLERVNKIVEKDGVYYAYCSVNVPDTSGLYDYYKSYSSDLAHHFKSTPLTLINITKYMLKLMDSNKIPTRVAEVEIKLQKDGDVYKVVSDDELYNYCHEPYSTSVSLITDILGDKMFTK